MGYYHIIYNSSQKGIKGGVGFGFRTYTKGTPQEYLDALQENDLVGYNQGGCGQLMPKSLIDNPEVVKTLPTGYFFTKLPVGGKQVHVLGRTIPVGFDYTFYKNFKAGRLGNYVMDCYMFDEEPNVEVLQILYENPDSGSNSFVPKDPCPKQDNAEMMKLSLEQMDELAPENKPFKTASLNPISQEAIWTLFALIEARKNNKALVITSDWDKAASLMADLYRLLPQDIATDFSFFSNYQDEGLRPGFDVLLINQYYNFSFSDSQVVKYNIDARFDQSNEWKAFGEAILSDLKNGNMKSVHDQVKWLLSPAYYQVKDMSAETSKSIYKYIIVPDEFSLRDLDNNEELIQYLSKYIASDSKHVNPFMALVDERLKAASNVKEATDAIDYLEWLKQKGFSVVSTLGDKYKTKLTEIITSDAESLSKAIAMTDGGLPVLSSYLDVTVMSAKNSFLDDKSLNKYWSNLYKFFYNQNQLEGANRMAVIERLVNNGVDSTQKLAILQELFTSKENNTVIEFIKGLIKANPGKVKGYWELLAEYLKKQPEESNGLIDEYKDQLQNDDFAPLFYTQLQNQGVGESPEKALPILVQYVSGNAALKKLVEKGFSSDAKIYPDILKDIKTIVAADDSKAEVFDNLIQTNVLDQFSKTCDTLEWKNLQVLLKGDSKLVTDKNVGEILNLSVELGNRNFFEKLVGKFISTVKDSSMVAQIVSALGKMLDMDLSKQLETVNISKKSETVNQFYVEILNQSKISIKEALSLLGDGLQIKGDAEQDKFFEEWKGDEYKSYKRKVFIKNLLKKPFFWIGAGVFVILLGLGVFFMMNTDQNKETNVNNKTEVPATTAKNDSIAGKEAVAKNDSIAKKEAVAKNDSIAKKEEVAKKK